MDGVRCQERDAQRGRIETGRAEWKAYRNNSLPGLLMIFARGWLTRETSHPMKEKESAVMGAGEGVCIIGWEAEHRRKRRHCPMRVKVKEKGIIQHVRQQNCPQKNPLTTIPPRECGTPYNLQWIVSVVSSNTKTDLLYRYNQKRMCRLCREFESRRLRVCSFRACALETIRMVMMVCP